MYLSRDDETVREVTARLLLSGTTQLECIEDSERVFFVLLEHNSSRRWEKDAKR